MGGDSTLVVFDLDDTLIDTKNVLLPLALKRVVDATGIPLERLDARGKRIDEVLASGQLTLGKYGRELEERFAASCGVAHGIAVNSGTSALEIILRSLDVTGRDVLVPANTFFATAAAVLHAGGRPVLMDTDPESFGTAPEEIERRWTPNTAGVVVVHIGGLVSRRMPEIHALSLRTVAG